MKKTQARPAKPGPRWDKQGPEDAKLKEASPPTPGGHTNTGSTLRVGPSLASVFREPGSPHCPGTQRGVLQWPHQVRRDCLFLTPHQNITSGEWLPSRDLNHTDELFMSC